MLLLSTLPEDKFLWLRLIGGFLVVFCSQVPDSDNDAGRWSLDILGHPVDPLDVVPGGTHWVHAVQSGATLTTPSGQYGLFVRSVRGPTLTSFPIVDDSMSCRHWHFENDGGLTRSLGHPPTCNQ